MERKVKISVEINEIKTKRIINNMMKQRNKELIL
jgi:hypothetical protein